MRYLFLVLVVFFSQGCVQQPTTPCISKQELVSKSHNEITIIAKSIQEQEKAMEDFATFIGIMKSYISDYSKTIEASAYLSNVLRVLPIPYAGEVSNATKLVSSSLVNLNNTATALHKYRESSAVFLKKYHICDFSKMFEAQRPIVLPMYTGLRYYLEFIIYIGL